MILVKDMEIKDDARHVTAQANIDGDVLFFKAPKSVSIQQLGDPFLCAAFFPAMAQGRSIQISPEMKISSQLIDGVEKLQEIFSCWYPELKRADVCCEPIDSSPKSFETASFFSGGIDGLYTAVQHQKEIKKLIYINGFDFEMPPDLFASAFNRVKKIADHLDLEIIPVETNFYSFMQQKKISRPLNHGSCLASVGLLTGFSKIYIPASYTYNQLHPWGSHPFTDHLWSNQGTKFIHDGADASRVQKTLSIVDYDKSLLENMVVCWDDPNSNCGKCPKCQRTMIALKILGVRTPSFSNEIDISSIKRLWISKESDLVFCNDNMELAKQLGKTEIYNALNMAKKRYKLRSVKNKFLSLLRL